jgi:hypothetical protein
MSTGVRNGMVHPRAWEPDGHGNDPRYTWRSIPRARGINEGAVHVEAGRVRPIHVRVGTTFETVEVSVPSPVHPRARGTDLQAQAAVDADPSTCAWERHFRITGESPNDGRPSVFEDHVMEGGAFGRGRHRSSEMRSQVEPSRGLWERGLEARLDPQGHRRWIRARRRGGACICNSTTSVALADVPSARARRASCRRPSVGRCPVDRRAAIPQRTRADEMFLNAASRGLDSSALARGARLHGTVHTTRLDRLIRASAGPGDSFRSRAIPNGSSQRRVGGS